jgi:hypothetical protein
MAQHSTDQHRSAQIRSAQIRSAQIRSDQIKEEAIERVVSIKTGCLSCCYDCGGYLHVEENIMIQLSCFSFCPSDKVNQDIDRHVNFSALCMFNVSKP